VQAPSVWIVAAGLVFSWRIENLVQVWDQPYLETCCRSALHRLHLSGLVGRPPDLLDGSCLIRLASMGLCDQGANGRFIINPDGVRRHQTEILKRNTVRTTAP
jgi:hypothetical protein